MKIKQCTYHRNGVSGTGFNAILFKDRIEGQRKEALFLGIVFEDETDLKGNPTRRGDYAVICLDMIAEHGVDNPNRWRGDYFIKEMRAHIDAPAPPAKTE